MVFLLIPGAGGAAWYWHRVVESLTAAGHEAIAVDLPADDETAGIAEYVEVALAALGDRADPVVVGQSLGGFTAVGVCERVRARQLVLVNAMIPAVGEAPGDWWEAVGHATAIAGSDAELGHEGGFDPGFHFLHDVPADVLAEGEQHDRPQSGAPFASPWRLAAWPAVETRVLVGRDDRFFPADLQVRLARERVGVEPELVAGGHLNALSEPEALTAALRWVVR